MLNWVKKILRTKKFKIDKRTVIITNNSKINKETLHSIYGGIQIFCMRTNFAKRFPKLTFVLEDEKTSQEGSSSRDTLGWVNPQDIVLNKAIVHLNTSLLIKETIRSQKKISASGFYRELSSTATHELAHIIQDKNYKTIRRNILASERMFRSFINVKNEPTLGVKKIEFTKNALFLLRFTAQKFIFLLLTEGAAEFFGKMEGKQLHFSTEEHKLKYKYAKKDAIKLTTKYNIILESLVKEKCTPDQIKEIKNLLKSSAYDLGSYMFFTIAYIFSDSYTPEDLLSLKPFKFIKLYEKAELINKQTPVVSLRSNLGYFDYNNAIKNWGKTLKKLSV